MQRLRLLSRGLIDWEVRALHFPRPNPQHIYIGWGENDSVPCISVFREEVSPIRPKTFAKMN